MRFRPVARALGLLLVCEAVLMLPSLAVALLYGEGDAMAFVLSIGILLAVGLPVTLLTRSKIKSIYAREGFALVALGWILLSVFGSLPFLFSGVMTSPVDAFFETVSGFTTTGSSVLPAVEGLPHGILFWRSFTNWVGGMGVLALTIALFPQMGLRNMEILRAESPGPTPEKVVPRVRETAKALYLIYLGMSAVLFVSLLFCGMPVFDSAVSTFSAAGTGGFSVLNTSIMGYANPAAEVVLGIFMLLFGVNFTVYFTLILARKWKKALKNQELIAYGILVVVAVAVIFFDLLPRVANAGEALRHSFFQVSTIVSTTGFASADFEQWPMLSRSVLVLLMIVGACAGSTAGGLKVVRLVIAGKAARRELGGLVHPRALRVVSMDGKTVDEGAIRSVLVFFFLYLTVLVLGFVVVSADGLDLTSTFTATVSALGNIGPGLGEVGPMGNYAGFSNLGKLVLSFCMLAGRLEFLPLLLLFAPSLWRR